MATIALLGTGRTGGKVLELAGEHTVIEFNESNQPTVEALSKCDVAISFLTGDVLAQYLDTLIEAGIPLASGSTGMTWPDSTNDKLQAAGLTWITASNFSIGMNLVYGMIKVLGKAPQLFDDASFKLHEIHHIHKQDAPSGTALSWQEWLGQEVEFEDERLGDTVGDHKLTLDTEYEEISLQHVAKDRKIFAKGAVWTAERILKGDLPAGLHKLSDVMTKELGL